jgi:hypothetical protein
MLITMLFILLVSLTIIGFMLSYAKDEGWPPTVGACPDYWMLDGTVCNNVNKTGSSTVAGCQANTDFSTMNTACKKYDWATKCGVAWDGITYGYGKTKPCVK